MTEAIFSASSFINVTREHNGEGRLSCTMKLISRKRDLAYMSVAKELPRAWLDSLVRKTAIRVK
jgi:hypothetical protein